MLKIGRTGVLKSVAAGAAALVVASGLSGPAAAGDLELIEEGTLNVAFNGDMPGTGWQDGKLIGLDGELMQMVAEKRILPKIDREFRLQQAVDALKYVGSRRVLGKVVVRVRSD